MNHGLWIMLVGSLAAAACAMVGCFLVLRKQAMMGDAISHSVLPGIVLAFLISGSRSPLPMLIGAGSLGLLTAFLTGALERHGRLQPDASIGVTFTWLFAVGVIMVSAFAGQVDLDTDCVLYGEIAASPWDIWLIGDTSLGPRAVWILGAITVLNLAFIGLGYKQLKLTSFDPGLAAAVGINVQLWHYLLMGFVSLTTVGAFESVGAILVVAMLIVPPNTAYLLTDRLSRMIMLSVVFGVLSAIGGYWLAAQLDGSIAGAIAVVSGAFFVAAMLFSPTHGVIAGYISSRNTYTTFPEEPEAQPRA
ncbi:MAG TPA: metal ABC transporter permease [Candidatus Hydrogenedentes bacterium]|nr:metal ABC transporter permease [Candidatus Hydrogenedentota bacterium]